MFTPNMVAGKSFVAAKAAKVAFNKAPIVSTHNGQALAAKAEHVAAKVVTSTPHTGVVA